MLSVIKNHIVLGTIFSKTDDLVTVYSTKDFAFNKVNPTFIFQSFTNIDSPRVMRALESCYGSLFKMYTVTGDWAPILDDKIPIWRNGEWLIDL